MDNFELPTNIKQIGTIDDGLRIYVEDYAATYIQQYTLAGENNERLALLVGRYLTIDSQAVLFISGAIEGKYCIEDRGSLIFTEKTHEYALNIMDRYFPSLEVVGWVQSQPGYGTYLGSRYYNYHLEHFEKEFQVLYVTDPVQKLNSFYVYDDEGELTESKGYFIYYDKNRPMHEYMVENKAEAYTELPDKTAEQDKIYGEIFGDSYSKKDKPKPVTVRPISKSTPEIDIKRRQMARKRRTGTDQKHLVNMLTGLCAVMFVACFIMGAGLMRSDDRINVLEQNLVALNTAYRNISSTTGQAQPAFASNNNDSRPVLSIETETSQMLDQENQNAANNMGTTTSPTPAVSPTPTPGAQIPQNVPETYTVQAGDSLLRISQRFYGTNELVDKIMEENSITDPNMIFSGQVLTLPRP
ncbi:MAG: LysM peptidoglycan-binding domain-containing protein [Clostridiales bacterium]|jgi:LysM repeat protein|nr:LysM peptidoglycan-binding domain-containing protein [Clostridiales bacterium]